MQMASRSGVEVDVITPGEDLKLKVETLIELDKIGVGTIDHIMDLTMRHMPTLSKPYLSALKAIIGDHVTKREQIIKDVKPQ